ncbi:coiled-coil domain-containing protein 178-like [Rhopilema esculentum]|uniref:coiled-coil domain-containing protein 178-like n=1 Tax=Rhopilema esculentum TaxID=499914 RepID=UPI0031DC7760
MDSKKMAEDEAPDMKWPVPYRILEKRRSCELTQRISPCIEKAVTHLYELEDRLFVIRQKEMQKIQTKGDNTSKTETQNSNWLVTQDHFDRKDQHVLSASGAKLEITGAGLRKLPIDFQIDKKNSDLPDFGERVVKETLLLLGRLETDRVNATQSLASEKHRVRILKAKIDDYAHRRMHFLPIAVQKEHELCAFNIQELKWHFAFKGRARDRVAEKLRVAEKVNRALKEEIDYINKRSPWVQEKVNEERDQMVEIQKHQDSTDTELAGALAMLRAMEDKYEKADGNAEDERNKLDAEVDQVRQELTSINDELSRYKMHYTSFVHSLHDSRQRLNEMADESEVLDARLENAKHAEKVQEAKVENLKGKIREQESEKMKLMEENTKLKVEKDEQKTELETQNAKLELEIKKQTQKLRELIATNRALEREIRNIRKLINDSLKEKEEGEKVVKRALMEMTKISSEGEILEEEISKVRLVHDKLTTTLEREREKCERIEEDLKTTADSLKKQLKDESHARTVLQARITADISDLAKTKADASKKKEKGTKRSEEIDKAVTSIKAQVAKMEKIHEERKKVIGDLDSLIEQENKQHSQNQGECNTEIKGLEPKEADLKENKMKLCKELDEMEWRTEMIEKRMQDMASSSVMMNRALLSTQEAIEELSEELNELKIQLQAGQGIKETLEETLGQLKARGSKGEQEHVDHMDRRERTLLGLQDGMQKSLTENTQLAKLYSSMQNEFMAAKDKLLTVYENALLTANGLKDKKELFDFRTRLHKALECYYKLRGIQTRAGILRFEQLTDENGERLVQIQNSLQDTLDNITGFLEANNASHHSIRIQAEETARRRVNISA